MRFADGFARFAVKFFWPKPPISDTFCAMRNLVLIALAAVLLSGCVAVQEKPPAAAPGKAALDSLRGGMSQNEVIALLGQPTSIARVSTAREGEFYESFTYVNTVIDPGVVEILFSPALAQIRVDTKLYRDFSE
jgi:hypothetical protein